jgi:hypothetical protein
MRTHSALSAIVLVSSLATGGCALGTENDMDRPAVIDRPTDASRAELRRVVNEALGTSVTLADDALTHTSTLSIERNPIRDASGRRIEVRERTPPEMFLLVKRGGQCVLIHERTKTETVLTATHCSAR